MLVCPSCGQENPAGFRLCGMCGTALTGPERREERKVVTVLFADLVGFTSRSELLDPEDVRAVLAPYHERLRFELERFGGTVEKFIGDAVMAIFGAPVAHEDDPERAIRAALAIRDWAREEQIELRVGINTGEALVTYGAEPLAAGDVVNTAARLQAAAPVNGILAGEKTYEATKQAIDYREAEPVAAKGKAEPVAVWEALDARARFGVDVVIEARAPLVGRERELAALLAALDRAVDERTPQLVTLVGVPGIGKSRLVHELFRFLESGERRDLVRWRQGRSLPYGEGVTFWALAEMVKAEAGVLEGDSPDEAGAKLARAVGAVFTDDDVAWVERHLRPLVGAGGDGMTSERGESFAAWRRFLEALAEQYPTVLIFEDLQWADDGLLDFVDELVDWASGVPLLVVCTARPELLERRPGWGGGKPDAATLSLRPLSDEQTASLIAKLLDRPVLLAETQTVLLARAGGNPLYAEQYARMLDERGESEAVPESVQGIIAARLDALSAEEKSLIHDAAVIGKVFWLGAVGGKQEILHGLERKEFVQRARRSSIAGETEFAFSHLLVRDVAYGQIPRPERGKKHRQVAEWIETLGRPEDHAEMLAHHWRAALNLARAAGQPADKELAERARQALSNAGDRAAGLNAPASAVAYYGDALDLWPADAQPPQLLFRFGKALHLAGDTRQIEALERAREALVAAGDRESAAEAESFLAVDAWLRGQRDDVFEHLARARDLVTGGPPSAAKARVLATSARYQALAAQHAAALEGTREALDLAETLGLEEVTVHALNTQGIARFWDGDPAGIDDVRRSLELALAQNLPEAQRAANNLATITAVEGDLREAKELYAEAQRLSERFGNRQMIRFQLGIQVWMRHVTGDWDAAMKIADEFVAESERTSTHYQETTVLSHRAAIRLARGDSDGALEDSRRAVELARQAKDPQALVPILGRAAVISVECGLADEARAAGEEALELVRESPGYADELSPLAPVAEALGLADEARALLEVARRTPYVEAALAGLDGDFRRAADAFVEIGATTLEADARLRAAEKLIGSGRRAEGAIELQKALAFYRSVGATACVRRGERLLAVSA